MEILMRGFVFLGLVLGCGIATFIAGGSLYLFNLKGKQKGDEQDFMIEDSFHIDDAQKNIAIF